MDFHRRLRHPNFVGDLFVLETGDNQHHHLAFTQRQRVEARAQFCNSFVVLATDTILIERPLEPRSRTTTRGWTCSACHEVATHRRATAGRGL